MGLLPAREEGLRELHPEWLQTVEHWMQVASTAGSRSGAYAKARKLLQERLDRAPDDSKAIYHLALVDAKTGHPEQAAAGFLSLLEGPSPDHRAVAGLAYSLRYTGWFTASEKLYFWLILQESAVYPPSRAWSQITKNRIYAGRYEGARQSDLLMYEAIREEAAPLTEKHLFYSGLVAAYLEGPESALPYWEAAWAM
ncbi:MAG: hypothetical protein MI861_29155, partial [Pirellulales bacterium]|nr:hypothetical protein [Pirellulales bacterium]